MPQRIQRKRTKGWRMPTNAIYVGRPTKWGNPFKNLRYTRKFLKAIYQDWILTGEGSDLLQDLPELTGKDLVCWCPLTKPCHADVLLELANQGEKDEPLP